MHSSIYVLSEYLYSFRGNVENLRLRSNVINHCDNAIFVVCTNNDNMIHFKVEVSSHWG